MCKLLSIPVLALTLLAGCRSYDLHSKVTDAELAQRLETHFEPGMPREEFTTTLDALKVSHGPAIWRDAPPGFFLRLYPPGGYWIDEASSSIEWVDVTFNFDPSWRLTDWYFTRDQQRYVGRRPYTWDASDGPPRNWPLQPLPPREWRGEPPPSSSPQPSAPPATATP